MKITTIALAATGLILAASPAAHAQDSRPETAAQSPETARLYDSLSAKPGWPTRASEAEVDKMLADQGISSEDRKATIAMMRQDVCKQAEMIAICRHFGAETIYKVQKAAWASTDERSGRAVAARLMEYGASRNIAALSARGLSDAQEAQLFPVPTAAAAKLKIRFESYFHTWLRCGNDTKTLSGSIPGTYRLVTCGTGFGTGFEIVIWKWHYGYHFAAQLTDSIFLRRVLLLWWPTGSEPAICSNSIVGSASNNQCNNYDWYSPVSFTGHGQSTTPSVYSVGTAKRLNVPFNVTIQFQ